MRIEKILIVYPVLLLLTSALYWVVAIAFWFSMPLKRGLEGCYWSI